MEVWKKIEEIPHMEVSNMGRFRTVDHTTKKMRLGSEVTVHYKGKIRKACVDDSGYEKLVVHTQTGVKGYVAHRLVAKYFLEGYNENLEVDHINDIRTDNRVENLRMITHLENMRKESSYKKRMEAIKNIPTDLRRERGKKAWETMKQNGIKGGRKKKPVVKIDDNTIEIIDDISLLENYHRVCICRACNGKGSKKNPHRYKGFDWYYVEDYKKRLGIQS